MFLKIKDTHNNDHAINVQHIVDVYVRTFEDAPRYIISLIMGADVWISREDYLTLIGVLPCNSDHNFIASKRNKAARKSEVYGLCQDCLAMVKTTPSEYVAHDYGVGMCACGGEICICPDCQKAIETLGSHDWSKPLDDRQFHVVIGKWSPDTGVAKFGRRFDETFVPMRHCNSQAIDDDELPF